jgi:hypothetical protein
MDRCRRRIRHLGIKIETRVLLGRVLVRTGKDMKVLQQETYLLPKLPLLELLLLRGFLLKLLLRNLLFGLPLFHLP